MDTKDRNKIIEHNNLKIGCLNTRGCSKIEQLNELCDDAGKFNLDILAISETHIKEECFTQDLKSHTIYSTNNINNSFGGTGFIIKKDLKPIFQRISDRICKAKINLGKRNIVVISVYAPTTPRSKKHPEEFEEFYEAPDAAITSTLNRDSLIIAGDYNAKIGSGFAEFPYNMGKYGKGMLNTSGRRLLELCSKHNLVVTNTLFKHKMCHTSTWTAPERIQSTRRNPIRNQIDFIIVRNNNKNFVNSLTSRQIQITRWL